MILSANDNTIALSCVVSHSRMPKIVNGKNLLYKIEYSTEIRDLHFVRQLPRKQDYNNRKQQSSNFYYFVEILTGENTDPVNTPTSENRVNS